MRAVVLTNNLSNQRALVHKLAKVVSIEAVIYSCNIPRQKQAPSRRFRHLTNRVFGRLVGIPFRTAWLELLDYYQTTYPISAPGRPIRVTNVNDPQTVETIEEYRPDVVIVSGTNIVGKAVMQSAQRHGSILNLHTGISPYVKGGPNCTNWCLSRGWFDLIGNTVMVLDQGVDTGAIIATERTRLDGTENLTKLHIKVMEHAHDLYSRCVARLADSAHLPSYSQTAIAQGIEFRSTDWTTKEMVKALWNFHFRFSSLTLNQIAHTEGRSRATIFPLPDR
jgi:folate-dependent phosphoribosylglycinamide formyltransferase PurN